MESHHRITASPGALVFLASAIAIVGLAEGSVHATTITQTASFPTRVTGFTSSPSPQYLYLENSGTATAPMNPFDSSLGTLNNVTVDWSFGQSFSGNTGSGGGGVTLAMGGTVYVNDVGYNGDGGGNGGGAPPFTSLSVTQANSHITNQFTSLNAPPPIWSAFTGGSAYDVTFVVNPSWYIQYSGIVQGLSRTYRDVTVTYDYTAAPPSSVPEIDPAGMGSVLALVAGAIGLLERRRLKAA